jgi:hypothetical protein
LGDLPVEAKSIDGVLANFARARATPSRFGDGCIAAIAAWPPCGAARVAGIVSLKIHPFRT